MKTFSEFMVQPISERGIAVVVHEVSHLWQGDDKVHQVGHVGMMLHRMEDLVGKAAWIMFSQRDYIQKS